MFIIDFDDTLFNTSAQGGFKESRLAALQAIGVDQETYAQTYEQARNHDDGRAMYSSERHAEALAQRGFDKETIMAAFEKTFGDHVKNFLFPDTLSFLESLKNTGQSMVLLSLGDPEFQYLKVKAVGIADYFDRTFMVMRKNGEVMKDLFSKIHEKEVWFINDKVDETVSLADEFPQMRPILKMSPAIPEEMYLRSGLPYFNTLTEIQAYVAATA